jgi:alpha-glucosidase
MGPEFSCKSDMYTVWSSVVEASKTAMSIRYSLLPYIYTLFHAAHTTGSTVMRALAWEFPTEPGLANADRQFLLGPSLLVTPVLEQGATSVEGVFPGVQAGTVWYDWYSRSAIAIGSAGQNITIDAPLGHIPLYVRGGSVLPLQEPALTTYDARRSQWGLLVALDAKGSATGSLYVDDGESLVQNTTLNVVFSASDGSLHANATGTYNASQPLANVTVLGVNAAPQSLTLNGQQLSSGWTYNDTSKALAISGLSNSTSEGAWAQDWTLSWS